MEALDIALTATAILTSCKLSAGAVDRLVADAVLKDVNRSLPHHEVMARVLTLPGAIQGMPREVGLILSPDSDVRTSADALLANANSVIAT